MMCWLLFLVDIILLFLHLVLGSGFIMSLTAMIGLMWVHGLRMIMHWILRHSLVLLCMSPNHGLFGYHAVGSWVECDDTFDSQPQIGFAVDASQTEVVLGYHAAL